MRQAPSAHVRAKPDGAPPRIELLAELESDTETAVERVQHGGRLGRSWLGPMAVVLIAAAVVAFGLFGGSSTDSALRVPPVPPASPVPPQPSVVPAPSYPLTADAAPHLPIATLAVDPASLRSVVLPGEPEPGVFAVLGSRVFFATMGGTLESVDLLTPSTPVTVATLPACHRIADIAAAAGRVIWVEAWSTTGAWTPEVCPARKPTIQHWRVWLSDVNTPMRRLVGSGQSAIGSWSDSIEPSVEQPSVAISSDAFAFDLPTPTALGEHATTIEIHDVRTGRRLWTVLTHGALDRLELGGDRVAYLQHRSVLSVATRAHPTPMFVATTDGSFSLSGSGRYLAWGEGDRVLLADFHDLVAVFELLAPRTPGQTASMPTVGDGAIGPIVFWRATDSIGKSSLVIRPTPGIGPLDVLNAPSPYEGTVQGTHLVWRSVLEMGAGITADAICSLDLAQVVPAAPIGPSAWAGGSKSRGQG